MKRLIILLISVTLLSYLLFSCDDTIRCADVDELKGQLIVISKGNSQWELKSFLLKNNKGEYITVCGPCFQSLQVGDTIK